MLRTVFSLLLLLLISPHWLQAQTNAQAGAVQLTASVQATPPRITIQWVAQSSTSSITIYRKAKGATSWGSAIATPAASSTSYVDNNVQVGVNYEYRVVRGGAAGQGYISTGIEVAPDDYRGKIILLVDNTLAPSLTTELQQLTTDLRADGWAVVRSDVSRTASVSSVRSVVQGHYNADPSNVKALYIIGHVPVPYSGNISPDGHSEHNGAWPCDGYYGELNGNWTDNSVNNSNAQRAENRNIPGDGKFDQSTFPSELELQVGRVDLFDMPAFSSTEVQLLRNYMERAHGYKVKAWVPQARGFMFDNFQYLSYPLAASGWRTQGAHVGNSNITAAYPYGTPFHTLVNGQSYLWTYACGGGLQAYEGSVLTYNGADNVGTTQNLATGSLHRGVFNMSMGSYFGDWDNKNNFLRAFIARGDGLTSVWSGMPAWHFHHMGMGDNIGYSALVTMNNNGLYLPNSDGWQGSIGKTHLGLMGDPSLRMKMVAPPSALSITNSGGMAAFSWTAAPEAVLGYHVYQFEPSGQITRLTTTPVTGTSHSNPAIPFVAGREYMVRAVKLEVSLSGSYYNLSLGSIATASGAATPDCLGVAGGSALPGTACNDNNPNTGNDTWNNNCQCVGQVIDCLGVPGGSALPGTACNDNNPNTGNDTWNNNCQCVGQVIDCLGVPGGSALPGTACNDNNPNTGNDTWNNNCQCVGQVIDCQGVPGGSALPGTACNDNNPNTGNDTWNNNCQCVGQVIDCLGVPGGSALPGTACNDNNPNTGNDTWNNNCQCVGQVIDCLGVPGGSALPGTACNDNDPNTINDVWSSNCQCAGTPLVEDCLGVLGGSALPGTACNDNDPNTANDTWNSSCQCVGQVIDCQGVPGGSALPGTACNDNNPNTGN
ncbi:MAG: hypothetical protein KF905_00005, partial [Flavobacteriales bacterium]|nr:hypothetical protein [Flavobacteriales bacterium]